MTHENNDHLRLSAPAAVRNREPIEQVLARVLDDQAHILELASGSGEHGVYMTQRHPGWRWQPSDISPAALASIEAWRAFTGSVNLLPPLRRDALESWPDEHFDALMAINLIHISPWEVTEALMAKAARHLTPRGVLFLYGPYRRQGQHTAPSNASFDADLKARDSRWGVRDLEAVIAEAEARGMVLELVDPLPANNLAVVFRRT